MTVRETTKNFAFPGQLAVRCLTIDFSAALHDLSFVLVRSVQFDYWMVPWWELEQGADDADDESDGL